jgi:hypothetical protein
MDSAVTVQSVSGQNVGLQALLRNRVKGKVVPVLQLSTTP